MRMSNAARRFVGRWREVRHRVPTEDAALVLRIRKRMDAVIRRLEAWRSASRERNDLTTAIQAPRRYFETSLRYLRSFGCGAYLGHSKFPRFILFRSSAPAYYSLTRTNPQLLHSRTIPQFVLFQSSQLTYYSTAPYRSPAHHFHTTPLLVPVLTSLGKRVVCHPLR
jgi:hypothetical protein